VGGRGAGVERYRARARHPPRRQSDRLAAAGERVVLAVHQVATPYADYAVLEDPDALPVAEWAVLIHERAWPTLFICPTAIAMVFPGGRLPSPRWRPVAIVATVSFAALTVVSLLAADRLREGLRGLFEDAGHKVIEAAADADRLRAAVREHRPDLAVVDIRMPPTFKDEGIRAAGWIRDAHPEVAVLVLSQHVQSAGAVRLVSRGGFGYLLKNRVLDVAEFLEAAERVARGGSALDTQVVASLTGAETDALEALTAREREVLSLVDAHENTADGIHIASCGGTWLALVAGFAGLRAFDGHVRFHPAAARRMGAPALPPAGPRPTDRGRHDPRRDDLPPARRQRALDRALRLATAARPGRTRPPNDPRPRRARPTTLCHPLRDDERRTR
jgi:DNA-binding NarL/FixJ family response regulator